MMPTPNTDLALAFLDILDKNGRHDLFAIGANGRTEAATFLPNDRHDLRAWIDARQGKQNIYVSINRGREDARLDWRLSKEDIGVVRAIAVDLDPKKLDAKGMGDPSGVYFRGERARLLNLVKECHRDPAYPPSLTVDSGGGYWLLWILSSSIPATLDNRNLVEGIGRTLTKRLGGDSSAQDVSRVMRLAGTINIPNAGKAAQGRTPTLSTIPVEFISDKRYALDDLAKWAPPTAEHAKPKDTPAEPIDWDAVETDRYDELPAELREKFQTFCEGRSAVGELWGGKPAPWQKDVSASGFEFALAWALKRAGCFTSTEFAQLHNAWDHKSETHAGERRHVQRAWDNNPSGASGLDVMGLDESKAPGPSQLDAQTPGAPKTEWGEPADLWAARFEPSDLPAGVVPQAIECLARDQAKRLGVEAGACATALVTAIGSLVPAGNQMQMRQHDTDWKVKPILWTALIGEPGTTKSPIVEYATKTVRANDLKWANKYAIERRDYDRMLASKQKSKKKAAKDTAEETHVTPPSELLDDWTDDTHEPVQQRKVVRDATTEKLCVILSKNPDGLLFVADELAGLFGGMDTYHAKAGKDHPIWLQAKDGGPYAVDRKAHDTINVENLAISVLGGIQPTKINSLSAKLAEDGMLQRFLPIIVKQHGDGEDVTPDNAYAQTLERITEALVDSERSGVFVFTPEGDRELRTLQGFRQTEIKRPGTSPALRQWLDKTPNEFGRLALVFHFIEWFAGPGVRGQTPPSLVSGETARRARRFLMEFVYSHARAFHHSVLGRSQHEEHVAWIAGYILTHGLSVVSERDVYRSYTRIKNSEWRRILPGIMQALEMEDWLSPCPGWLKEGRPTRWFVNPAVHEVFAAKAAEEQTTRLVAQNSIREEGARRRAERQAAPEPETARHA
jgi:Protein of unknown function (DUF3987)